MTTSHLVCFALFRLFLPLCLATFVAVRQNGLSLVYLVLLLCLPLFPVPTHATMKGHTGRYLKAVLVLSLLNVIAQVAFQVLLLAMPPYAHFLTNCEWLEVLLRALGLVRFDDIAFPDAARLIGPDLGALVAAIVVLIVCKNMCDQPEPPPPLNEEQQSSRNLVHISTSLGKFVALGLLCVAGSMRPSLPGAVYFVCFLGGATAWACRSPLQKGFAYMMRGCVLLVVLHILTLFTYQVEWFQQIDGLAPTNLTARLLGLTPWTTTSCEEPRHVRILDAEWATFVNPLVLIWLYYILIYESKMLLDPIEVEVGMRKEVSNGPLSLGSSKQNSLLRRQGSNSLNNKRQTSRRRTLRWKGPNALTNQRRVVSLVAPAQSNSVEPITDATPLMKGQTPSNYEAVSSDGQAAVNGTSHEGSAVNLQDSTGSRIWCPDEIALKPIKCKDNQLLDQGENFEDALEEQEETSIFEILLDAVLGLLNMIIRSSYIATNIIMMAWSIAYHSWLTFVLLLWASLLWITPNQRRAMLRCSPALAIYAQLLLIAQYIYSLDLTNEELPETVDWVNLRQIGLIKPETLPVKPLVVKSLFTLMFWVTLRQFMQERYEAKHSSALVGGIAEPFNITVTTTASGLTSGLQNNELADPAEVQQTGGKSLMNQIGSWVQSFLTKFWIWVVAIMLFVIGLGSGQVVLYRIVYMALFLIFVLTFQFSYRIWRAMMYGFWLTVIVYSMLVLVMIYTYQFDNFPEYWYNYTGIPDELQHDIGLEIYDTGSLFVRLLTPTFFVVITVIQLHYFHKDFLAISDIRYRVLTDNDPESGLNSLATPVQPSSTLAKPSKQELEKLPLEDPITPKDLSYEAIRKMSTAQLAKLAHQTKTLAFELQELLWRLLELHMVKITLISVMLMAVNDVCGAHAILVVLIVAAMPLGTSLQRALLHVCSGLVCLLILTQMTYQIKYINHAYWDVNCTNLPLWNSSSPNSSYHMNDAEWLGLKKSSDLPDLLKGYIGLVLVFTFQAVVRTRQQYQRRSTMSADPPSSPTSRDTASTTFTPIPVLFGGVSRANADEGLLPCAKYLLNYGFYKFGVEVSLMTMVILIGTRLDMYSIIYSVWLAFLFKRPRMKLSLVWKWFILFVCIFTPLQYVMCVGLPPGLCIDWPWDNSETLRRLQIWLFMSDYVHPPECQKLICDFVVLMLICRQQIVFRVERSSDSSTFVGGSNLEVFDQLDDLEDNPVPDFITYTKSWLDNIKRGVLRHFYWFTLIVVLVTGVNRNNIFSLGYLVGAFFFLHHGNDLYLLPVRKILKWWNILLSYNVAVIGLKAVTQMLGCLFVQELQTHACWFVQLLSITCLSKFGGESVRVNVSDAGECTVSSDQTGLVWDGVCFGFLLMQRRLFSSFYFARIVDEAKAQTILASRGAELIEQLRRKRVAAQKEEEQRVLDKIRTKMERIKENQRKMQGENFREPQSHQRDDGQPEDFEEEPVAPLEIMESHSGLSSPHTPQGYHTPVDDDDYHPSLTPQRLSQLLSANVNAPTPTSGAYTICSLDGYMDPGRISIGSPPHSDSHRHIASDEEESFPVFSPPPYEEAIYPRNKGHRRSLSHPSHPFNRRSMVKRRRALVPPPIPHVPPWQPPERRFSTPVSPSQSHHTYVIKHRKVKRRHSKKVKAIRSGDYYMFEDFDDDLLDLSLEPTRATVDDVDDEGDENKVTVSKLLSTALKTDIETAADQALVANLQDSPIPMADEPTPRPRRRKKSTVSYLSGRSELAQPSTSVSARSSFQSTRIPPLNEDDEPASPSPPPPPPGGSGGGSGQIGGDVGAAKEDTWASKLWVYMKFLWALMQSGVVSATKRLNKLSRDYRYVAQCLAAETLSLKEKGDYRFGARIGHGMWRPLPSVLPEKVDGGAGLEIRIVGASDEATLNVDHDERQQQQAIAADQRSEEKNAIPTIKIWAASLERGLDSDGAVSPISISDIDGRGTAIQKEGEPTSLTTGLFHALWFAVLAHSELVCYGMVFLHQVKSASILSLPLPLMVFLWGSLSVPRPSKFFWVTIIGYTEMVVIAKYLCQFEYLPWNQQAIPYNQPLWGPRITGVERKEMYALYDLMLLLVVFFHRFMLKSLGLWGDCDDSRSVETNAESCSSPATETAKSPEPSLKSSSVKENDEDISEMSSAPVEGCGTAVTNRVKQTAANLPAPLKQVPARLFSSIVHFFATLLEPSSRVTADVYAFMFMCDFLNFMVVIFGFASFGTQQGDGGVSAYLEENKVPVAFLVMLILQFALMVVDRALFLRKFILGKIMFQVGLVFGVHLWMFFLLPSLTERPFSGALPPQIWYLVKCLYLLLSAYQIRCGYPTRILGNFLCKKYNYLNMFLFKGFMAVPFLFELRTLMDWMWTKTSMTLGEWIKMEDIFAHIFQLKCQRRAEAAYPRAPGEEQRPLIKYVVGGCSLLVVIFIIWFPMVLFALGNTVGQPNLPYDVSVELTIGPYQPVFRTSAQNSSLVPFSESNWESLSNVYKRDRAAQTFLSNYDWSDVQVAKIDNFSMSVWTISEQAQKKMMALVLSDEPLLVKFLWTVSRHSDNPSTVPVVTETQTNFLMATLPNGERNPERLTLANMLNDSFNGSVRPLRLQNLFPKFIKVSNRGKATVVTQLMKSKDSTEDSYRDLLLTLDRDEENREHWWEVGESCTDEEYKDLLSHLPLNDRCKSLQMYTFNDKAFPAGLSFFSGGGIIGLYTTLVLVASKFMRGFFSGVCFTIMFDDLPDVDRILQLCLDIYLVRESGELSLEEALAAKLIFLFRSPSTLIKWSRPREEEDGSEASSDEDLRSRQGSRQQAIMQ